MTGVTATRRMIASAAPRPESKNVKACFHMRVAMTGGNFNTQVIATLMWKQAFTFFDSGRGAALAIILLVAVTPVMWYNLRQFRGRAI